MLVDGSVLLVVVAAVVEQTNNVGLFSTIGLSITLNNKKKWREGCHRVPSVLLLLLLLFLILNLSAKPKGNELNVCVYM